MVQCQIVLERYMLIFTTLGQMLYILCGGGGAEMPKQDLASRNVLLERDSTRLRVSYPLSD